MAESQTDTGIDPRLSAFLGGFADGMNGSGSAADDADYRRGQNIPKPATPTSLPIPNAAGGGDNVVPFAPAPKDRVDNAETRSFNYGGMRVPGAPNLGGPKTNPAGWQQFSGHEAGVSAIQNQLHRYVTGATTGQPLTTLRGIVSTWAPPSENDTNLLIHRASAIVGADPDQQLNFADPKVRAKLLEATIRNEQGGKLPVDPAVIQKVANDPSYTPAPEAMVDRFDRTAGMMNAVRGPFTGEAKSFISDWNRRFEQADKDYRDALAEGRQIRDEERKVWQQTLADRPPKNAHEAFSNWQGSAMLLALLGGFTGRSTATAALSAAGALLQGANDSDEKAYQTGYREWKDHSERLLKYTDFLSKEVDEIYRSAKGNYDHLTSGLSNFGAMIGIANQLDPQSAENLKKAADRLRSQHDIIVMQQEDAAVQAKAQEFEKANGRPPNAAERNQLRGQVTHEGSGTATRPPVPHEIEVVGDDKQMVRRGAAYQDSTGNWLWVGTNEPVSVPPGGAVNLQPVSGARSASQEYIRQFKSEHPKASAEDIAQANAEYTRLSALDRDFASGPDGRNLISLNTVADHIPLFRRYAAALKNGDTPLANSLVNEIARQTGHSEITNFELARDFLADEVARVLVPGGSGGALADRQEMKDRLKANMSPEQLAGGGDVATNFIKGKLEALCQQYGRGDEKRGKYFDDRMLTSGARELFGNTTTGGATSSAPSAAVDYLRQHPEARDQFDQKYGAGAAARALGQ
jgi:hypothetical protein